MNWWTSHATWNSRLTHNGVITELEQHLMVVNDSIFQIFIFLPSFPIRMGIKQGMPTPEPPGVVTNTWDLSAPLCDITPSTVEQSKKKADVFSHYQQVHQQAKDKDNCLQWIEQMIGLLKCVKRCRQGGAELKIESALSQVEQKRRAGNINTLRSHIMCLDDTDDSNK